jgi:hypothetical protein
MTDGAFLVNRFVGPVRMRYHRIMKRWRLLLSALCVPLLAGCFPLTLYYQEGAEVARIDRDLMQCRVEALAKVPVDRRSRYIPPLYDHRTVCNAAGACSTYRIMISPARWETYDANEGFRAEVAQQCMLNKGYARVRLPACSQSVIEATTITATQVQPPLTAGSCAIRLKSGRYQIVTTENR